MAETTFYTLPVRRAGREVPAALLLIARPPPDPGAFLAVAQVLSLLLPSVSKTSLLRDGQCQSSLPLETAMLRAHAKLRTPTSFRLIPLPRLAELLESKGWGTPAMLADLQQVLIDGTSRLQQLGGVAPRQPPREPSPPPPPPPANRQLALAPIPPTLPPLSPAAVELLQAKRYGLTTVAPALLEPGTPLAVQLTSLHTWLTAGFRADRPSELALSPNAKSWKTCRSHIYEVRGLGLACLVPAAAGGAARAAGGSQRCAWPGRCAAPPHLACSHHPLHAECASPPCCSPSGLACCRCWGACTPSPPKRGRWT